MATRRQARILVVDDEPDMCWMLSTILRAAGYSVDSAVLGSEALKLLGGAHYDAAFVDAKLADMDSIALLASMRQVSPGTQVVMISGYYYPEDPAIAEGLDRALFLTFLAKPFDLDEVRRVAGLAVGQAGG